MEGAVGRTADEDELCASVFHAAKDGAREGLLAYFYLDCAAQAVDIRARNKTLAPATGLVRRPGLETRPSVGSCGKISGSE